MITRLLYRDNYEEQLSNLRVGMRVFSYYTCHKGTIVKIALEKEDPTVEDSFDIIWDDGQDAETSAPSGVCVAMIDENWQVEEIVEE